MCKLLKNLSFGRKTRFLAVAAMSLSIVESPAQEFWSGTKNTTSDIGRDGRVGIGTTTPSAPLHVVGDQRIEQGDLLFLYDDNDFESKIYAPNTGIESTGHSIRINAGGAFSNSGFDEGGHVYLLAGDGNSTFESTGDGGNVYIDGGTGGSSYGNVLIGSINSGNVGIGTASPAGKLHVNGLTVTNSLRITGSAAAGRILQSDASGNATWVEAPVLQTFTRSGTNVTLVNSGDNVGIGVTSPTEKFEVDGNMRFIGNREIFPEDVSSGSARSLVVKGGYASANIDGGSLILKGGNTAATGTIRRGGRVEISGGEKLGGSGGFADVWVNVSGGDIYLGGGSSYVLVDGDLDVTGDAYCASGMWTGSDRRYKQEVETVNEALDKVLAMRGTRYAYKQDYIKNSKNLNGKKSYGFIAQELMEVLPEAVATDSAGYHAVNYDMVIPVLVEAIKAQQGQIEELKAIIKSASGARTADELPANTTGAALYQNTPNPFTGVTAIPYYLPQDVSDARIEILDINGRLMKEFTALPLGFGEVQLTALDMQPGAYVYVLYANGQKADAKRMVLNR